MGQGESKGRTFIAPSFWGWTHLGSALLGRPAQPEMCRQHCPHASHHLLLPCRSGVNELLIDWFAASGNDLQLQEQIAALLQVRKGLCKAQVLLGT